MGNVRLGALAGVGYALLYLFVLFGLLDLPTGEDTDRAVQEAFVDDRTRIIVSVYLLAVAGVLLLWFLGTLSGWLRRRGAPRELTAIVLAGGAVYVAMLFAAAAGWGVLALGTALDELPEPVDPTIARVLVNLGFALVLVFGLLAAAASILAVSAAVLRGRLAQRWIAWAGVVIAALLLLGPFYAPQALVPVWVVLVAGALLWRATPSETPA